MFRYPYVRSSSKKKKKKKRQRPTPRGLGCPQIGHLELEGKTNLGELWDVQFPSIASGSGQEGRPGGTGMWRMLRFSPEFGSYGKPGSGAGWASIEHPMQLLSPATWAPHSPVPLTERVPALQRGRGCVLHLTLHLLLLSLHLLPPLCFCSKAGVEIPLGLQRFSPGDLSPDRMKPIQFTHMPH